MFKKVAADALGLSDIGSIIKPEDYDKVEADDYILHEEAEKIYFLIKSKADEYCFTNLALVHVDGTSAMSKKRTLKRYDYSSTPVRNVLLETAGTIDKDVEIKFHMGDEYYSIDVDKKQIEELKDLYKALMKIAKLQEENEIMLRYSEKSLATAERTAIRYTGEHTPEEQFKAINQYAFSWMKRAYDTYVRKDYGEVFAKFINN